MRTPIHPSEHIQDLLNIEGMSPGQLDKHLGLEWGTTHDVICFQKPLSDAYCECLGQFFLTSKQYWVNLQAQYDEDVEAQNEQA